MPTNSNPLRSAAIATPQGNGLIRNRNQAFQVWGYRIEPTTGEIAPFTTSVLFWRIREGLPPEPVTAVALDPRTHAWGVRDGQHRVTVLDDGQRVISGDPEAQAELRRQCTALAQAL